MCLALFASGLPGSACSFLLEEDSFCGVNFSTSFCAFDLEACFLGAVIAG